MTRKAPKTDTVRALYLISGNECAFDGCNERIINSDGDYIGQICHIEAAEKRGERYNDASDDEARRSIENLVLLCYPHHTKTDNVETWTVDKMRKMKAQHEKRFITGVEKMIATIRDETLVNEPGTVVTAKTWTAILGYDGIEQEGIDAINAWAQRLKRVTRPSRQLLAVIVGREGSGHSLRSYLRVDLTEVQRATEINPTELLDMIRELTEAKLLDSNVDDERYGGPATVYEYESEEHGVELADLRKFCSVTGIPITQIVVDLELSVFD